MLSSEQRRTSEQEHRSRGTSHLQGPLAARPGSEQPARQLSAERRSAPQRHDGHDPLSRRGLAPAAHPLSLGVAHTCLPRPLASPCNAPAFTLFSHIRPRSFSVKSEKVFHLVTCLLKGKLCAGSVSRGVLDCRSGLLATTMHLLGVVGRV